MEAKYFVDENATVRDTVEQCFGCYLLVTPDHKEVYVVDSGDDCVTGEFTLWSSLLELENIGVNTTPYRIKKFLQELSHLNEKADTIGEGKLASIKEQAEYLLNKLDKE